MAIFNMRSEIALVMLLLPHSFASKRLASSVSALSAQL